MLGHFGRETKYPVGSVVAFVKYHIPITRKLWYNLKKKISILRTSRFFIRSTQTCYFPGYDTPTYAYKNFCYLMLGETRLLALDKGDADYSIIFDFKGYPTYSDLRAVVFIRQVRKENYGYLTLDIVNEKFKQLLKDLDIPYHFEIKSPHASVEVAKTIQPDLVPYFTSKLLSRESDNEVIKGKYANYSIKIVNIKGLINVKLVAERVPLDKIRFVIEEGKKILQSNLDLTE